MPICRTETIEPENLKLENIKRNGRAFSDRQNFPLHFQTDVRLDTYPLHIRSGFARRQIEVLRIYPDACIVTQALQQSLEWCAER